MVVAVARLCVIFGNQRVGCVAIVAGSDGMVTAFGPRVEMVLHDMAIRTDTGLIADIGETFGVNKGV